MRYMWYETNGVKRCEVHEVHRVWGAKGMRYMGCIDYEVHGV